MDLTERAALRLMERAIALAIALSSLELFQCRSALRDDGVFAWPVLRRDFEGTPPPFRTLLDGLLAYRPFVCLLGVQLAAALLWIVTPGRLFAPLLLASHALVGLRFRGSFNGGSDYMTSVVLTAIAVAEIGGSTASRRIGLGYAAAQLVLSYFASGIAKLAEPEWRRGHALARLLNAPQYQAPATLVTILTRHPRLACVLSWSILAFECSFPVALLAPQAALVLLALALCFHLANALVLGLNRFLWAWAAAFPALVYWSTRL